MGLCSVSVRRTRIESKTFLWKMIADNGGYQDGRKDRGIGISSDVRTMGRDRERVQRERQEHTRLLSGERDTGESDGIPSTADAEAAAGARIHRACAGNGDRQFMGGSG